MSRTENVSASPPLKYYAMDIEQRLGFRSQGGTDSNAWLTGIVAAVLTILVYVILTPLQPNYIALMFCDRGPTQHACVFFGFWCMAILLVKQAKLRLQRRSLNYSILPSDHQFVLSSQTADSVVTKIHSIAADPERFVVYSRILTAISNLKNLGRVSDVDDILNSLADRDESAHETSFGLINGFLWAIPVLGFIGTVLGLSWSIAKFAGVLANAEDFKLVVKELQGTTAGLSTAFETTLVALVIALVIQLWMTAQKIAEERFLDDCNEYCLKQVVSRIKILPYEQSREI